MPSSGDGNSTRTLKCDEECARLERNHKLAVALHIDPATHKDGHIPYSKNTLSRFQEQTKWAQPQERLLRVFAADDTAKRMRFKPMAAAQRAFLHDLAEDFGFDSESMDPEPHRHVAVFKTPRFVAVPLKTLAQCVELRESEPASSQRDGQRIVPASSVDTPYNGFLLTVPRFGLTVSELRAAYAPALASVPQLAFEMNFLPSEEIVMKPSLEPATPASERELESYLRPLRAQLSKITMSQSLADSLQLCRTDTSLNIVRRELIDEDGGGGGGGWSQVAAKAAAPRAARGTDRGTGGRTVFTVPGRRKDAVGEDKKRKEATASKVADDWEQAEEEEEMREKGAGSGSGVDDSGVRGSKEDGAAAGD
ncbi:MAG: FKBP12-associated protein [Thelocarpon impressellum]|nr:MAG: FKBP12-associated protein [Thelocarpon impressellum]